ncbi:MAG: DUF4365 domain-containing protein [Polyangiaceae bacterium]|nr:DUF4365 domain-containing protein [Polyangiaceae bacterium]
MPSNIAQEQIGLSRVLETCAKMDAIWRPTPNHDLGIDGQIEFLEPGTCASTGILVAVQVKSGPSYFKDAKGSTVPFYPEAKHRRYWLRLRLPVILVLHDPTQNVTIYDAVRPHLMRNEPVMVPISQTFDPAARADLVELDEDRGLTGRDPERILASFREIRVSVGGDREISGIEFLLTCTDIADGVFELRMCRIMELLDLASDDGICVGADTYDFILRCVLKCWGWGLVESFEPEFSEMWWVQHMVPDVQVPITRHGRAVLEVLLSGVDRYVAVSAFPNLRPIGPRGVADLISKNARRASVRLDGLDKLGEVPR